MKAIWPLVISVLEPPLVRGYTRIVYCQKQMVGEDFLSSLLDGNKCSSLEGQFLSNSSIFLIKCAWITLRGILTPYLVSWFVSDCSFASVFTNILHDGPCPHCLIYSYLEKMGRKFFLQMLDKKPKFWVFIRWIDNCTVVSLECAWLPDDNGLRAVYREVYKCAITSTRQKYIQPLPNLNPRE